MRAQRSVSDAASPRAWLRYAAAASTGLTAAAAGDCGLAAVVHSGPINEVMQGNKDFPIDLNLDGLDDFVMVNRRDMAGTDYWRAGIINGANYVAENLDFIFTPYYSTVVVAYVDQLPMSQSIPGELSMGSRQPDIRGHILVDTFLGGQYPQYFGSFTGNGIAGVRFEIGGGSHYGWIQLNVDGSNRRYTVVDWAYENLPDTPIHAGDVGMPPDELEGDYNDDGTVNAADYVVWRNNEGTMNPLPNDPHGGTIGAAQYNTWQGNFGQTLNPGSGASAALPEPGTVTLGMLALGAAGIATLRRGRESRNES
jgi:hypothetical protein